MAVVLQDKIGKREKKENTENAKEGLCKVFELFSSAGLQLPLFSGASPPQGPKEEAMDWKWITWVKHPERRQRAETRATVTLEKPSDLLDVGDPES
ncbi:hypothetical protein H920_01536 [Fukomys damarensis]|uniref:Uncharacterized protein n=1 Tax=Fukomys damarensis TaxID=885580 RepID=A0A091E3C0_FUKDA|nr:hypothetical protein H920_01536 [Fukomys damarensis]